MGQSHESTVSDSQLHSLYDVLPMLMVTATNSHEAVSLSVAIGQFIRPARDGVRVARFPHGNGVPRQILKSYDDFL